MFAYVKTQRLLVLGLCLVGCRSSSNNQSQTMIAGGTSVQTVESVVPLSACGQYQQCCTQINARLADGSVRCVSNVGEGPLREQFCATALDTIARTDRAAPVACRRNQPLLPTLGRVFPGQSGAVTMALVPNITVNGELASGDSVNSTGPFVDRYVVPLGQGSTVTVEMRSRAGDSGVGSQQFDSYLVMYLDGREVGRNDDGAGNLNARLTHTVATTGIFTIEATTYGTSNHAGAYTLEVTLAP